MKLLRTQDEVAMLEHIDDLEDNLTDLTYAAVALLLKIEGMTSAEFTIGGESKERNALRATLTRLGAIEPDGN